MLPDFLALLKLFLFMDFDEHDDLDVDQRLLQLGLGRSDNFGFVVIDGTGTPELAWYRLFAVDVDIVRLGQFEVSVFRACR